MARIFRWICLILCNASLQCRQSREIYSPLALPFRAEQKAAEDGFGGFGAKHLADGVDGGSTVAD